MKKYIALILCVGHTLFAREFTIVNKTGGQINGSGNIPQTIHSTPLGQEKYTPTRGNAAWRSGTFHSVSFVPHLLTLPSSTFTLEDGAHLKVSLPDEPVHDTTRYGYRVYDFTQAPTYDIKTSKVVRHRTITVRSGPVISGKPSQRREVTFPVYARTSIVPQNGETYTLSLEGNDVIVSQSTVS